MSDEQIALEAEAVALGRDKYNKRLASYVIHRTEDQTAPAIGMMRRVLPQVAEALELDRNTPRRGRARGALHIIEGVESEALAWHGLRCLLSSFSRTPNYTWVSMSIGTAIKEELNFRKFQALERTSYNITQQHIATAATGGHKRGIMKKMFTYSEIDAVNWSPSETARVGVYVLEIVLKVTNWASTILQVQGKNRRVRIVEPKQELLDWLQEAHHQMADLSPVRMPMIVPPLDWSTPHDGGYLTDFGGKVDLVKSGNKEYQEALEQVEMPEVYVALNAIQSTAWKVNTGVLRVAEHIWQEGAAIGKAGHESMPSREPLQITGFPAEWEGKAREWKATDPQGWKLWARRAAVIHDENRRLVSKRLSCAAKMQMADRFADQEAIYFPHQLDFRGRVYPVPHHLSPQGDDLSKALIHFSEGKRMGADGVTWMKVHVANCFGVDKVSFEDRIRWTEEHMDVLLDSGIAPLEGDRFWTQADDPFLALAACFELVGISIEGEDYVSHLPVSVDGSCNGLQNFSALLRDEIGGKATNLVPQDVPADVYNEVATLVAKRVREMSEAPDLEDKNHRFPMMFDGYVNRSLVKQPVMTQPYGATRSGMQNQIEAAVKKAGNPMAIGTSDMWGACSFMAKLTYDSIGEVVVAARLAMDWLQDVARKAASEDYPIRWTTPVGLPVLQEYRQMDAQRLRVHIDGQRAELFINHRGTKLDRRRQALGISPNLIHSFDAAHMMKTIVLALSNGITSFAMIHDSYGCHASDVPLLNQCLREAFIEMYSDNLLGQFKAEVEEQLPAGIELPDLPPFGTLDLSVIRDSRFFFS